jgi:iron-sulfur cluster assembly protein
MIHVTVSAATKLQALLLEHPDEAIVRIALKDLDDQRLVFSITLEAEPLPEDAVYEAEGVTIVVDPDSIPRIEGITLDYEPTQGFRFQHPAHQDPTPPDEGPDGSGLEPFSHN